MYNYFAFKRKDILTNKNFKDTMLSKINRSKKENTTYLKDLY